MSPLGKDIHVTTRMGSTQPSLHPAEGINVTVTIYFFSKVSAYFHELSPGGYKMNPIHSTHIPGGFAPRDASAPVTKTNTDSQSLFVIF